MRTSRQHEHQPFLGEAQRYIEDSPVGLTPDGWHTRASGTHRGIG
jgi:hypothetical protein